LVVAVPYPNAKVAQRIRRLHTHNQSVWQTLCTRVQTYQRFYFRLKSFALWILVPYILQTGPGSQAFTTMINFSPFLAILYNFLSYSLIIIKPRPALRVLRLSIRDCAGSPNNFASKNPNLSVWKRSQSMGVWCWFQDGKRWPNSNPCPRRPHPHRSTYSYFSIFLFFWSIFCKDWPPAKCDLLGTFGNLADYRYPPGPSKKRGARWIYHCLQKKKRKNEGKTKHFQSIYSISLLFDYMYTRLPLNSWSIAGVPLSQVLSGFLIIAHHL